MPSVLETVVLASIQRHDKINCRAEGVNAETAAEYAAAIAGGAKLPPVVVFRDESGALLLADGFHRCRAHELAGKAEIEAEVHAGDARAALLYAVSANTAHGLRRTNADKRRAVVALLCDAEWSNRPHREIARKAAVDHVTVANIKRELVASGEIHQAAPETPATDKPRKAPKAKKGPKFNPSRVAKRAPRALDKLARGWPKSEPLGPLLESVRAWVAARSSSAGAEPSERINGAPALGGE